jgi:hypothetical protein
MWKRKVLSSISNRINETGDDDSECDKMISDSADGKGRFLPQGVNNNMISDDRKCSILTANSDITIDKVNTDDNEDVCDSQDEDENSYCVDTEYSPYPRDLNENKHSFDFHLTEGQSRRGLMADCEVECSPIFEFLYVSGAAVASSW